MMSSCKVTDGYGTILVSCYTCLFLWKELCSLIVILKYLVSLLLASYAMIDNREVGFYFCFLILGNQCRIKN